MRRVHKKVWFTLIISALMLVSVQAVFAADPASSNLFPAQMKLAPSRSVASKEFSFRNTTEASLQMSGYFDYHISKYGVRHDELASKYLIRFIEQGERLPNTWMPLDEVNHSLKDIGLINANEGFEARIEVKLDESAGNEYQSAILHLNFYMGGKGLTAGGEQPNHPDDYHLSDQSSGSPIQPSGGILPNTATEMYKLLLWGFLVFMSGLLLLLVSAGKKPLIQHSFLLFVRDIRHWMKGGETK